MKIIISTLIFLFILCNASLSQYKGGAYDGYDSKIDTHIVVISSIKQIAEVAVDFHLYQNFPNPFNPVTNINFSLRKGSNVTLKIYNVNGKLIQTLLNDVKFNIGVYNITFDGSQLSSGIYFYKILTDNFSDTKKMILTK